MGYRPVRSRLRQALLAGSREPTDKEIYVIENVCRCSTYPEIRQAIARAAQIMTER